MLSSLPHARRSLGRTMGVCLLAIGCLVWTLPTLQLSFIQAQEKEPQAAEKSRSSSPAQAVTPKKEGPAKPAAPSGDKAPIRISRCRIMLIDRVNLAFDRNGVIDVVKVREGDTVKAGNRIASLRDDEVQITLLSLQEAEKAYELAQSEFEQANKLHQRRAVPSAELQRAKLTAERAALQSQREKAKYEYALRSIQLTAPFDGTITRLYKSQGEVVRPADPIVELISTRRVRVEGYLNLQDAMKVRPGMIAVVQLDLPGVELDIEKERFEGRVTFVDVGTQPVTGQIRFWAEVVNRDGILRSGLTAHVTLRPDKRQSVK